MPDRRSLLSATLVAAGAGTGILSAAPAAAHGIRPFTPQAAFDELIEGNHRWVTGLLKPRDPAERRLVRAAGGQDPFAVVFSCIDSRVPPEIVFDQDLGDLFVVRTAGHAFDVLVSGSVEYGPAHGTPLVMVLGHTRCGAVTSTVESIEDGTVLPGHLPEVVAALAPAYFWAEPGFGPAATRQQRIEATIRAQVDLTVRRLLEDPVLRPLIERGTAGVAGGVYDLQTGEVSVHGRDTGETGDFAYTTSTPAGRLLQATASRR